MPRHKLIFKVNGLVVFQAHGLYIKLLFFFTHCHYIPRDIFLAASVSVGDAPLDYAACVAGTRKHTFSFCFQRVLNSIQHFLFDMQITCCPLTKTTRCAEQQHMYDTGAVRRTHKWSTVLLQHFRTQKRAVPHFSCVRMWVLLLSHTSSFTIERRDFSSTLWNKLISL